MSPFKAGSKVTNEDLARAEQRIQGALNLIKKAKESVKQAEEELKNAQAEAIEIRTAIKYNSGIIIK